MQWAKAKTIMIWLFLAVDIILAANLAINKIVGGKSSNDKLIRILENNNLSVREDILTIEKKSVFANEFKGLTLTDEIASEFMEKPIKTENNSYRSEDKAVSLSFSSGSVLYENQNPDSLFFSGFSGINEKNAEAKIQPYLKALGIGKYVKAVGIFRQNEDICVEYSYFFNDKELFSSHLTVIANENGIKKIYGNINIPNDDKGYDFKLSGIETVLLNFVQNNSFSTPETVVSITEGYYCISYDNLLLTQAIPVYRIKTTDKTYIYDARDGIDGEKRQLWHN